MCVGVRLWVCVCAHVGVRLCLADADHDDYHLAIGCDSWLGLTAAEDL